MQVRHRSVNSQYSYGNAAHSAVYSTKLYTVYEIKYQVPYEYKILNFLDLLINEVIEMSM